MNCRNFPEIATSIARGELIDAAIREEARAHAATCTECASRLADEMRLTEGLKLLSRADESRESTGFNEALLRQAFRTNVSAAQPAIRAPYFSYLRLAAGIAAAAVVFVVGASVLRRPGQVASVEPQPVAVRVTPAVEIRPSAKKENEEVSPVRNAPVELARVDQTRGARVKTRERVDGSYVDAQLGEFRPANYEPEETTEFIPTIQGSDLAPLTSGQVVRVMVPKSAMSYFGLPVNVDRANDRVAADVLLGEDGLARAIRFVR